MKTTRHPIKSSAVAPSKLLWPRCLPNLKAKTVLSRIAPATVLLLVLGGLAFSGGQGDSHGSIAGAWINTDQIPGDPNTLVQSQVITPLDPAGASFVATVDSPNLVQNTPDSTSGRPTGTYVPVGPNRYKFTLVYHRGQGPTAFPGRAAYVAVSVFSGTAYLTDHGTLVNDGVFAVFPASADVAPRDGFPDEGAVPAAIFPWRYESKRVEGQEPYPLL